MVVLAEGQKDMKNVSSLLEATFEVFAGGLIAKASFPLHILAFLLPSQTKIRIGPTE